jgi:hypothetical protein
MRQLTLIFGIAIAVVAIIIGARIAPKTNETQDSPRISAEQEMEDFNKAQKLMAGDQPEEALEIIYSYKPSIETLSPQGLRWMELFIEGSVKTRDSNQLIALYEFFPEIFKEKEEASLLTADAFIIENRPKDYQKIRSLWTDRETKVAGWFLLDVDALLLEGRRQEAIEKLNSRSFGNKADVGRLVRLALLYGNEDPRKAWTYLAEAYGKDPKNPDVRSYRAKLLESVGKHSLAHKEYQSASKIDSSNLFLKDQLVDFYLRHRHYPMALDLLQESLTPPSLGNLWVKALFWNKVTTPLKLNWEKTPIPDDRLASLVRYMMELNPDLFWNQAAFERIPHANFYLKTRQETFWLRVLQALKDNKEAEASNLLKYNPFASTSWYPDLEVALKRVLNYRQNKTLKLDHSELPPEELIASQPDVTEPNFFQELAQLAESDEKMPESVQQLLLGKEAYAAVFLAAGWTEAGLQMHTLPVIPEEYPNWVAFAITQALQHNRSNLEAMEFASLQKPTPELKLLMAELIIAGGDHESAIKALIPLTREDSEAGYRSAWLTSLLYIEKKEYDKAKAVITAQPRLAQDVLGQETLARIAHLEGNTQLADRIYKSIETKSPEARSYLARKAFKDQDWKRARELTELLIEDYPENPTLRENLKKIIEKESNEQTTE